MKNPTLAGALTDRWKWCLVTLFGGGSALQGILLLQGLHDVGVETHTPETHIPGTKSQGLVQRGAYSFL